MTRLPAQMCLITVAVLWVGWRDALSQPIAGHLVTIVQQDRLSGPVHAGTARVSARGSHIVFTSYASLVPADTDRRRDVYVFDLATRQPTLESAGVNGTVADGESGSPDISGDGRYVVFVSFAGNLVTPPIPPGVPRVFLRDRETATTRLVAVNATGQPVDGYSTNPAISADGSTIVFESAATDLVASAEPVAKGVGVYLVRRASGVGLRVDVTSEGEARAGQSVSPAVSADGRSLVFMSRADLTCVRAPACLQEPPDRNGVADIYLRDTVMSTTRRVSLGYARSDPNGPSYGPAISGDGRHVVFVSEASNLTRRTRGAVPQIYAHDLATGETEVVSRNPSGQPANGPSLHPAVSYDGATMAFQSLASDLLCQHQCEVGQRDTNLVWDVYVYDRRLRSTHRASADAATGADEWMENSRAPSLDGAGRVFVFVSRHPLGERDQGDDDDLYVLGHR